MYACEGALQSSSTIRHVREYHAAERRARVPGTDPPVRAKRGVALHIIHLAVPSHPKPLGEAAAGRGQVEVRDPHRLEAEFGAPGFDLMRLDPIFRERGHG